MFRNQWSCVWTSCKVGVALDQHNTKLNLVTTLNAQATPMPNLIQMCSVALEIKHAVGQDSMLVQQMYETWGVTGDVITVCRTLYQ